MYCSDIATGAKTTYCYLYSCFSMIFIYCLIQSPLAQPENMFGGLKIDMSAVHKDLPDFDARSTITSKTTKGLNLTKKDKRKLKHEFWMKSKLTVTLNIFLGFVILSAMKMVVTQTAQ